MPEELELQMIPTTELELQISRFASSNLDPNSIPPVSCNLSLREVMKAGGKLDRLEIEISFDGDDPRLRGINIYTQYSGVCTLLITHGPRYIYPTSMAFYALYPGWDNEIDRVIDPGESVETEFEEPVNYSAAKGLYAHSFTIEGNEGGSIQVGMIRGKENDQSESSFYGGTGGTSVISVSLGQKVVSVETRSTTFAINSHNPICERTYTFKDYHPIPIAIYNVWGFFNDQFGSNWEDPINHGICLADFVYQPENLKAGKIVSKSYTGSHYIFEVKCYTQFYPEVRFDSCTTGPELMNYEVGRWVLISRTEKTPIGSDNSVVGKWHIIPSSQHYWKDAVDYFRKFEIAGVQ